MVLSVVGINPVVVVVEEEEVVIILAVGVVAPSAGTFHFDDGTPIGFGCDSVVLIKQWSGLVYHGSGLHANTAREDVLLCGVVWCAVGVRVVVTPR